MLDYERLQRSRRCETRFRTGAPAGEALPSLGAEAETRPWGTARRRWPQRGTSPAPRKMESLDHSAPTLSTSHGSSSLLEAALTNVGATVGTPRFMAPEQHTGDFADERADQFSFCVSLYYALYRSFPFVGESAGGLLDDILAGKIADPPEGFRRPWR